MTLELTEIVLHPILSAHEYDHPDTIDPGLPNDESIPDGEKWVGNCERITTNPRPSNGFLNVLRGRSGPECFEFCYNLRSSLQPTQGREMQ